MYQLLDRLWVKENMKKEAAQIFTNLIRGKRVSRETGRISENYLQRVKKHLKNFKTAAK